MSSIQLTLGKERVHLISNAEELLRLYRKDTGCYYLDYQPITPSDRVVPEDLAATLLVNS